MAHRLRLKFALVSNIACVLAVGALVAGCDRCGDWNLWPSQSQSCKPEAPR